MLAAVEDAVNERWGHREEILAAHLEVTHALLVAFMHANTDKSKQHLIPKPFRYPRPARATKKRSWVEVLSSMGRRG